MYNINNMAGNWRDFMSQPSRLALLKEIAEFLNEETEMYSMMNGALHYLLQGSQFTTGWIFFIDDSGHHELVADSDLPGALQREQCQFMHEGSCWCVRAYHNHKLTKASNIINCSRINLAAQAYSDETEDITHHATVPLKSGDEQFGLLNVAAPHKHTYSDDDLELLESVAFQIGSAIKRILLTNKEKERARVNERNRLARDLHDSVNQMLFSLKITAHAAQGMTTDQSAQKAFQTIEDISQSAVNEMRSLIWQLKPVGLEQGLVHALYHYSELLQINLNVSVDGLIKLPNTIEENIYRIAQEAMNNVKKHANTEDVDVTIKQHNDMLYMSIVDQGKGFDITQVTDNQSLGLKNLKQRVGSMKGKIEIHAEVGQGTAIYIEIPLT
ncbi:histidine kinase [Staphylococcus lugdunensis]|uniref:histidine kinase n=2 Tax=Staphylococcus TaxID=1279 RepID=A0ABD4EH01_STALU|nr:histidine kinase [Staphylococcus lugdunensis]